MRFGGVLLVFSFACGGTAEVSRDLHGLALDSAGQPIAGAKVHVGAQDAVTDAVGYFGVVSAPVSYDATLSVDLPADGLQPARKVSITYAGLTRRDPLLWLPQLAKEPPLAAPVSMEVTDGQPSAGWSLLALVDAQGNVSPERGGNGAPLNVLPFYSGNTATLVGLILQSPDAGPAIRSAGTLAVTAAGGGDWKVQATPTAPFSVRLDVTAEAGCTLNSITVEVAGEVIAARQGPTSTTASALFNVGWTDAIPLLARAIAHCPDGDPLGSDSVVRRLHQDVAVYSMTVRAPPAVSSPTDPAKPYSWIAPPSALSLAEFDDIASDGFVLSRSWLATAGNSATAPAAGQTFKLRVFDGIATTDSAAAPGGLNALLAGTLDSSLGVTGQ